MCELLKGTSGFLKLPNGRHVKVDAGNYLKDRVVALYFAADWSPSCHEFTWKLKRFYNELKATNKKLEVVFASHNRKAEDLHKHYEGYHGPWVYLMFGDAKIEELKEKYAVKTILTLKIVKPNGDVVVPDALRELDVRYGFPGDDARVLFGEWEYLYFA